MPMLFVRNVVEIRVFHTSEGYMWANTDLCMSKRVIETRSVVFICRDLQVFLL